MRKKVLNYLGLVLVAFLTLTNVNAKVLEAGNVVDAKGTYDSSYFVFGNEVKNETEADGLGVTAGNIVDVKGKSLFGLYAGNMVTINSEVEKDLFIAGNNINIGSDAIIGRDAYIAGSFIKINTNIERNLNVGGSSVDLSGITINGNAYIAAEEIILDENTVIEGKLTYYQDAKVEGLDKAKVGSVDVKATTFEEEENTILTKVTDFIMSALAAFITMVVLFYLLPSLKEKIDAEKLDAKDILGSVGKGLIILIVVPFAAFIGMITGILLPLSLMAFGLYIAAIYLSTLIASYFIGKELLTRAFKNDNVYLALCLGIVLVKLIAYIPVVGGLVAALALLYGLGLEFKLVQRK